MQFPGDAAPLFLLHVDHFSRHGVTLGGSAFESDHDDDAMITARRVRMQRTTAELKRRLAETGLHVIVDDAPARDMADLGSLTG